MICNIEYCKTKLILWLFWDKKNYGPKENFSPFLSHKDKEQTEKTNHSFPKKKKKGVQKKIVYQKKTRGSLSKHLHTK